jgi:putative transposase
VLVLGERHLRRILTRDFAYYHRARTHLALDRTPRTSDPLNCPERVGSYSYPEVGGLHHRYVRQAAQSSIVGL